MQTLLFTPSAFGKGRGRIMTVGQVNVYRFAPSLAPQAEGSAGER